MSTERTLVERIVLMTLRALIFVTCVWATAFVLAGQYLALHPLRHVSYFSQGFFSGNRETLIGQSPVGDSSRFLLNPTWDVHTPPTTRVYNWSEPCSACKVHDDLV